MNHKKLISVCSLLCISGVSLSFSLSACAQESNAQSSRYVLKMDLTDEDRTLCQEKAKQTFQSEKALNESLHKLNTLKDQLDDLRHDFAGKRKQLDLHRENSVNDYNQLNQQISDSSQNYQSEANRYNQAVRQHQTDINWIKNNCL